MSVFRRIVHWQAIVVIAFCSLAPGCSAEDSSSAIADDVAPAAVDTATPSETSTVQPPEGDPFAVPPGDAAELLAFIRRLADPDEVLETEEAAQQYLDAASKAISAAADKILAGQATDQQVIDAMEWKIEALRIQMVAFDNLEAARERDEFLTRMLKHPRPEVASTVARMRLVPKLSRPQWSRLDESQRKQAVDDFVADVQAAGPTAEQATLLLQFCDMFSDTHDSDLALHAIDALLPTLSSSTDPDVQRLAPSLEAIARRINLPGSKMELSGTLMDGTQLDWASYRGKVVLVDFWASWCGPCRREVPNVLENYKAYRDKGFEVVGICLDDDRSEAEKYIEEAGVTWPSLFSDDPESRGWDHPMAAEYAINAIPRAILVDQEGVVVDVATQDGVQLGMMARGPMLGALLKQLLGDPVPQQPAPNEQADDI